MGIFTLKWNVVSEISKLSLNYVLAELDGSSGIKNIITDRLNLGGLQQVYNTSAKTTAERSKNYISIRAMAAWEQKIPVDITVEERHRTALTQYRNKLKIEPHVVPDPFYLKSGWIGESIPGMKKWPSLYYMDTAKYLKNNSLSDCLLHRLNCEHTEEKVFRYFSCDFVKEIYFHDISDTCPYCFTRTKVISSQRTSKTPYTVWPLLQKDKSDQPGTVSTSIIC